MAENDDKLEVQKGEDGSVTVDLAAERPSPLETINLVEVLSQSAEGKAWLKKRAQVELREYEDNLKSSDDYRAKVARHLELFAGTDETISSGPAEGARRANLPIMAKVVLRIWARVNSMVQATDPVAVPTGEEDNDRAQDVSKHLSWQRRAKTPEWGPGMSSSVMQWIIRGSMFRWIGWDPIKEAPVADCLTASEVVMPYSYKDVSPNLQEVERITRILRLPRYKVEILGDAGHYFGIDTLFPPDHGEDEQYDPPEGESFAKPIGEGEPNDDPVQEVVDRMQGVARGQAAKDKGAYCFLECYSWARLPMDLPGDELVQPGKRRRMRPICMTIEKSTKRVIRLVVRERENPLDRKRFEREAKLAEIKAQNDQVAFQQQGAMQGAPPPQPPKPPRAVRMETVHPFIHYPFFPNPEGIYGFGAGLIAAAANEIANVLMTEDIVARRISNVSGSTGFVSKEVAGEKGEITLKYGSFKGVEVPISDLPNVVHALNFNAPQGGLMADIQKLEEEVESAMSATGIMSGEAGPSHETAAAAKARSAHAMTAITAAMENFLVPLAFEFKAYARLNSIYLSDVEYFYVTEPDPEAPRKNKRRRVEIGRDDYVEDWDITFSADARMALDPGEGASALQAYDLLKNDPIASGDQNLILKALKKALKALKASDLAAELPDEIPPPPPPTPTSQENENAGFMNEEDHPVLEDDDDNDHLSKMEEYQGQGLYSQLSPTGKQLFDRHERAHNAQAYLKAKQLQQQLAEDDAQTGMGNPLPGG
jgi:hypothetical protein